MTAEDKKQEKIINYLVGQVMKSMPAADPRVVREILEEQLREIGVAVG